MTTFFVETDSPNGEEVIQKFVYSAQEMGHNVVLTKERRIEEFLDELANPLVFFGSLNMIRKLQDMNLPYRPIAWCDWNALACRTYYEHYRQFLIQTDYGFYTFRELGELTDNLYRWYGFKNKIFVRPDSGDKIFTGEVVGQPQFDYWYRMAQAYDPKPDSWCIVSKPTQIKEEYRFVLADGKVIAGSRYKIAGMFQYDGKYSDQLVKYAEEVAAVWQPHEIFVMDLAVLHDDDVKLIEIGQINGAGLYKCEIRPIVAAMAEIAERS